MFLPKLLKKIEVLTDNLDKLTEHEHRKKYSSKIS